MASFSKNPHTQENVATRQNGEKYFMQNLCDFPSAVPLKFLHRQQQHRVQDCEKCSYCFARKEDVVNKELQLDKHRISSSEK
jgi:hypothetical protein